MKGVGAVLRRLDDLPREATAGISRALGQSVVEMHAYAVQKIQGGSRSGKTYRRGSVVHQASAPGEFPKTDRGQLVSSLFIRVEGLAAYFGSMLNYAKWLELGTSRMAARPWLRPTFNNFRELITKRVNGAINEAVRKIARG